MKKEDYPIGTRVATKVNIKVKDLVIEEPDCDTLFGAVVQIAEKPNKVIVKWDNKYYPKPVEILVEKLMTEEEAKGILFKLEYEYKLVAEKVKGKMIEAGQLLREAEQIALRDLDKPVSEMRDAIYPLTKAMDECGWSTSSLFC